ncbi:uncharacterized protein BXZ73DRAFT_87194 [Epithele typhae]|uniref:uncharacterized protein n=1 Tax=Epithele typhae TaxID=378194 RepID=UPI002008C908|nr:uncharacterized protein BXZ73DRAFT_87194 [Epithele typhae]KAH9944266.1 hypothetical protein BXZ73DRAFT_87194 [Epithele typhae]
MTPNASHDRTLLPLTAIATRLLPPKRLDVPHPSPIFAEPPTPSSAATIRDNLPPALEDDVRMSQAPRARSSSRTYRWIEEQQHHLTTPAALDDTPQMIPGTHPYLAYPSMSAASLAPPRVDYVNGGVGHSTQNASTGRDAKVTQGTEPPSDASTPRKSRSSHGLFFSAQSPLRGLHLNFSPRRACPATSGPAPRAHSPAASSTSTFRRTVELPVSHARGSSPSVSSIAPRPARADLPEVTLTPPKTTVWKFKRPSVSGHFTVPSQDEDSEGSPPPRPSTSSSFTQSGSSATRISSDAPRKMYFGSTRSQSSTTIFGSSPSLWSLPADASHMNDPPESTKVLARDRVLSASDGATMTWRPQSPSNFGTITNVLSSPRARKKRKLIISGIPPHDERRFDAVRKWCESFGELSSISRVPNGDLHIDFRKSEVSDTVCRLNARVHIAGVGSVGLSWFTGKRP